MRRRGRRGFRVCHAWEPDPSAYVTKSHFPNRSNASARSIRAGDPPSRVAAFDLWGVFLVTDRPIAVAPAGWGGFIADLSWTLAAGQRFKRGVKVDLRAFEPTKSEDRDMITLYAQPYNIDAIGFSFQSADEFFDKSRRHQDRFGQPVEEFEIQFIDGEELDAELAKAIGLNQANFADFLTCAEDWDTDQKTRVIIAVGEGGYTFDPKVDPDSYDIDLYQLDSLRALVELFIDEGLFGDIPERLSCYLDYDAIARDLSFDYCEITLGGTNLIYRLS